MPSTKNPIEIVDPQTIVVESAQTDKRIVLNTRINLWPDELKAALKVDEKWQWRCKLSDGYFISPELTDLMNTIEAGEPLIILCQDAGGKIFTTKTNTRGVYWIDNYKTPCVRGVLGQIRTETNNRLLSFGWHIWASYILAVARLSTKVKPSSTPDPTGEIFLANVKRYGRVVVNQRFTI